MVLLDEAATLTPSKCLKVGLKAQTVDAKRVA